MKKCLLLLFIYFLASFLRADLIVQDELIKVYQLAFDETVTGSIRLHNSSYDPIRIIVSQADFSSLGKDEYAYTEPGKNTRSNAQWISCSNFFMIAPRTTEQYQFTIHAPKRNDLQGSYWSILFLEEEATKDLTNISSIEVSYRYEFHIISSIINTGEPIVRMESVEKKTDHVSIGLENTGSLWIDSTATIDIYNATARFMGSYIDDSVRIYPGFSKTLRINIPEFPPDEYYAIITINCGNNYIYGHQLSFTNK